jgi:predicted RNase H-like nuclease (RuvC/YqgF family)
MKSIFGFEETEIMFSKHFKLIEKEEIKNIINIVSSFFDKHSDKIKINNLLKILSNYKSKNKNEEEIFILNIILSLI